MAETTPEKVQKAILHNEKWVRRALASALHDEAQAIMRESQRMVPVDTGHLRRSKFVALPKIKRWDVEQVLGYGSEYAYSVHEGTAGQNLSAKQLRAFFARLKEKGPHKKSQVGGPKYLERAIQDASSGFESRIAEYTKRRWESQNFVNRGVARSLLDAEAQARAESEKSKAKAKAKRGKKSKNKKGIS